MKFTYWSLYIQRCTKFQKYSPWC